jgi:hypothetical protein
VTTQTDVIMHSILSILQSGLADGEGRGLWYDSVVHYLNAPTDTARAHRFTVSFRIIEHNEPLRFTIDINAFYYIETPDLRDIVIREFRMRMEEAYQHYAYRQINWNQEGPMTGRNATWNQTPAQRAEQAEQQRREAGRGAVVAERPTRGNGGMANTLRPNTNAFRDAVRDFDGWRPAYVDPNAAINHAAEDLMRREDQRWHEQMTTTVMNATAPIFHNGVGGGGGGTANQTNMYWNTAGIGTRIVDGPGPAAGGMNYYMPQTETVTLEPPTITSDMVKLILKEMLKDKLDIKISVSESDGEVDVEVEVTLDGEVIASDSDSVTIEL